jgi:hypothetical protein
MVEKAAASYRAGASIQQVAAEFGAADSTMRRVLLELGVELRPSGRRRSRGIHA